MWIKLLFSLWTQAFHLMNFFFFFFADSFILSGHTHSLKCVRGGQNEWPGLFTEWIIIPSVPLYCMYYPSEQTVAGLLVPLASVGLRDLHIGPWWFKRSEARRCHWLHVHACGAGENVFHARGDRRQEGAPREPARGRQKEGRSGFLRATPNRFPGKTYLHTQDSATSYPSELWHVCIEQMDNFFRAFLQKFQPIKLRSWALFSLLLVHEAHKGSSGSGCSFWSDLLRHEIKDEWKTSQKIDTFPIVFWEFMH